MSLEDTLGALLPDVFAFYLRAHGHHWNVEGEDFFAYHQMFGDIATEVYGSIDPLAENIRKLGTYVPFRIVRFAEAAQLPDQQRVSPDCRSLAQDLYEMNQVLLDMLRAAFRAADEADQQGIANFLAERIDAHSKHAWFLRSSIK